MAKRNGFTLVEILIVTALIAIMGLAMATIMTQLWKSIGSLKKNQEALDVYHSINGLLANEKWCPVLLGHPNLGDPWSAPYTINSLSFGGQTLLQTGANINGIVAQSMTLEPPGVPGHDVKVAVSGTVYDMKRYAGALKLRLQKYSAPGDVNTGGDALQEKTFFITATVDAAGQLYSCYGGQTKEFFQEMCERILGGQFDDNRDPSCLISRLGVAAPGAWTTRDDGIKSNDPATHTGAISAGGHGIFTDGSIYARRIFPAGQWGAWRGGLHGQRSWIGDCSAFSGCSLNTPPINNMILHISGVSNSSFPTSTLGLQPGRVIGLLDHVVLPENTATLGISNDDIPTAPYAKLHTVNSGYLSGLPGAQVTDMVADNPHFQAEFWLRGHGDGLTYSSIRLAGGADVNTPPTYMYRTSPNGGWYMAYIAGGQAPSGGFSIGTMDPGITSPVDHAVFNITAGLNVGIGTRTPSAKLHVVGDAIVAHNLNVGGTVTASSDKRLKTDIQPIENALEKILSLEGVSYNYRSKQVSEDRQIGLIAQEVQKVFPEVVKEDRDGLLSIAYQSLIAPLIEAIGSLYEMIQSNSERLRKLEARQAELEAQIQALQLNCQRPVQESVK